MMTTGGGGSPKREPGGCIPSPGSQSQGWLRADETAHAIPRTMVTNVATRRTLIIATSRAGGGTDTNHAAPLIGSAIKTGAINTLRFVRATGRIRIF